MNNGYLKIYELIILILTSLVLIEIIAQTNLNAEDIELIILQLKTLKILSLSNDIYNRSSIYLYIYINYDN